MSQNALYFGIPKSPSCKSPIVRLAPATLSYAAALFSTVKWSDPDTAKQAIPTHTR
jgi:hypothetical protein